MPRPIKGPPLTGFQEWLAGTGRSNRTVALYASLVRSFLSDLPRIADAWDPSAFDEPLARRAYSTRGVLESAWSAYSDFVQLHGAEPLPPIQTAMVSPLPEEVQDAVAYCLESPSRTGWRRSVTALSKLTWRHVSRQPDPPAGIHPNDPGRFWVLASQDYTQHAFVVGHVVYDLLAYATGREMEQVVPVDREVSPLDLFDRAAPLVPATRGGNAPAAPSILRGAAKAARRRSRLAELLNHTHTRQISRSFYERGSGSF